MCYWPLFLMLGTALLGWLLGRSRKFDTSDYDLKIKSKDNQIAALTTDFEAQKSRFSDLESNYSNLNSKYSQALTDIAAVAETPAPIVNTEIKEIPVETIKEIDY